MNIDEFELNYLLVQKDIETGNRAYVLDIFRRLTTEIHDKAVYDSYGSQIDSLKLGYYQLLLFDAKELFSKHQYREALSVYSQALSVVSTKELFLHISYCLAKLGYTDLALAYLERGCADSIEDKAYSLEILAEIHNQNCELDQAIKCLEQSQQLVYTGDKEYRLSSYYIASGDFKAGSELAMSRFTKENNYVRYPQLKCPLWNKSYPKGNILVHWEQGFGDTIMFSRFIKDLLPYADKVYLVVRQPMLRLMEKNFKDVSVINAERLPSDFDYHIPMMSLFKVLEIDKSSIKGIPYLTAKKKNIRSSKKKIGLSWQGSLAGMPERNISLLELEPILRRKDIQLYSFQKGLGLSQSSVLFNDLGIIDLGSTFTDFYDTACSLLSMDLFISTDNCLANLAGALGVPTILLLNHIPECRWMNAEEKTIWYDSIDIIKQKRNGDWSFCVETLNRRI